MRAGYIASVDVSEDDEQKSDDAELTDADAETSGIVVRAVYPGSPAADAGIRWNDGDLAIDWPVAGPALSGKDAKAPFLADVSPERLPIFSP